MLPRNPGSYLFHDPLDQTVGPYVLPLKTDHPEVILVRGGLGGLGGMSDQHGPFSQ